ncbi:uncharacterized protein K460DRAFT_177226 [Cucurbitaria berberidis CBS 394.84]|uniref:Ribosomal protein L9 domain-containing protein n=1 Tax=Cucurbitaria berberidis CBS 394.84 TaxID=1168544 RepID=A0A9P4GAH6_9PLEO|nr:uncharacterized protein K460DRAFT_177226 [Cucurbitaria berberidis CBS 394.84]KAF1841996.1 hypothetical protein K460DRAFT_177226 [Cucurbitaria berberidis CBS 394.84]
MALFRSSTLLPQCTSCVRRFTRQNLDAWGSQQTRTISKKAKEAERNIVVKLLKDVPRFGRAGSYVPLNPSLMRNRWFPARVADYVPATQLKQMKAQEVDMARDFSYGVRLNLEEAEEDEEDLLRRPKHYIRPIEIDLLSPERSMELLNTFVPPTIDFYRQRIEQDKEPKERYGASGAADILTAAAMGSKAKAHTDAIYGSVSTADLVATIKGALAHNDEAARVMLNEADVRFVSGHEEGDASRVKQLGTFKVEIRLPSAEEPIIRNIRIRAKESEV